MHRILRRPGQKREKQKITKDRPRVGPLRPKKKTRSPFIQIAEHLDRVGVTDHQNEKASLN
jgi:hypothetical protein